MFDTVNLILNKYDCNNERGFLCEVPQYLQQAREITDKETGEIISITSNMNNLYIKVTDNNVIIKNSLCKYFLGDNMQTLGRGDTKRAIEQLSDTLHLPINKATITAFDFGTNVITECTPNIYFAYLGELSRYKRGLFDRGLYYSSNNITLAFYDKIKEKQYRNEKVPELYQGKNVLRYELRYKQRVKATFKRQDRITAETLYNEDFYIQICKNWRNKYIEIQKIHNREINFDTMRTTKALRDIAMIKLIQDYGAEFLLNVVKERQQLGEITKKQAYDLRADINRVIKNQDKIIQSEEKPIIEELNTKVKNAIKYYR